MKRSFAEFLQDILEAITEIESFMVSVSFVDFRVNREKVLAVVKLFSNSHYGKSGRIMGKMKSETIKHEREKMLPAIKINVTS
jgi:hypothetical protein